MRNAQRRGPRRIIPLYPLQNTTTKAKGAQPLKRVAAYCRVSSSSEEQLTSFNAQMQYYQKYILEHPDYEFAGIYADATDILGLKQNPTKRASL